MPRISPTLAQFEFAARLRQQREYNGIPAQRVSEHVGFSRNAYSAIENSRRTLTNTKLEPLLDVLGFDDDSRAELTSLLHMAKTERWWHKHSTLLDKEVLHFFGLEYGASVIESYEGLVFSGLLQSPIYSRHVIGASPSVSRDQLQRFVDIRATRQEEILKSDDPPQMTFLFGEAVLMQQFGGPDVLREQLIHVVNLVEEAEGRIQLRIQKFSETPLGMTTASTLVLLGFSSDFLPSVAYREAGTPIGIVVNSEIVSQLRLHYQQALQSSCDHQASVELMTSRIQELR